jgi:hypothetical protein
MKSALASPSPPGLWSTVFLLLRATRKRATGRQKRQQELLRHRTGKKSAINWGNFGFVLAIIVMAFLNLGAAFVVYTAVTSGERLEAESKGKIVVDRWFLKNVDLAVTEGWLRMPAAAADKELEPSYSSEASMIVREYGGTQASVEKKLRDAVHAHGTGDFISVGAAVPGFRALPRAGIFPAMLGSIVLIWWAVMLVFQGEGLELDLQRRRHPMWEWLFSHPVPSGAIFLAEMLSPIAANPIYWGAPLFAGFLYGFIYGPGLGFLAGLLIGVPISVAAACLGKALEIGAILRFSPRTRGAMLGLMSWMGYASMMLFIVCAATMGKIVSAVGQFLEPLAIVPWPWLGLFLGEQSNGGFSFLLGMLFCWGVAGVTITGSVWFSIWGAQLGLSGNFGRADSAPSAGKNQGIRFGREPLYRKEFLWFIRDRSAIVQTILVPLTVAGFQLFNMRGLLLQAQSSWNLLCGAGILFGTYFLWILGPKSLASEGAALWIALTWPRGLESLLKAKAWLWSLISTGIVSLVLIYTAFLYPDSIWKVILVGIGWWFFGRSMAEKAVTLVSVPSSSGEPEKIPMGPRGAPPTRYAYLLHWHPDSTMAHRHHGHRLFLRHCRRHVGKLPRPLALPLRSLVRKIATPAHAHARHDRNQHPGRRWRGPDRHCIDPGGTRKHRDRAGRDLRHLRGPGFPWRRKIFKQSRCSFPGCLVLVATPKSRSTLETLVVWRRNTRGLLYPLSYDRRCRGTGAWFDRVGLPCDLAPHPLHRRIDP